LSSTHFFTYIILENLGESLSDIKSFLLERITSHRELRAEGAQPKHTLEDGAIGNLYLKI
jgi:hypothetical protein